MKGLTREYRRIGHFLVVGVVVVAAAGCGTTSSSSSSSSTSSAPASPTARTRVAPHLTIGLIVPTTGPLANGGAEIVAGSQAAAAVWNATHDKSKVSISLCNDQGTAAGGLQCVYRLQGSVSAIAGPDFATDFPGALPALQSSGKIDATLAADAHPARSSTIFVAQPSVSNAVTAMMSSLRSQGYKNVGVLVDQEPSGLQAATDAEAFGHVHGMKIESASFPDTATTAVPPVQQLLSASPQALLVWCIGNAGVTVLNAIGSLNVTLPTVMNYFNVSPALFAHAQLPAGNRVGVLGTVQFVGSKRTTPQAKAVKMFESAYTKIIHQPPSWAGSVGGNAIDVIMAAEQAAGPRATKMGCGII